MTTVLQSIPEKYRKVFYVTFALVGVVLGATAVGFATAGVATPVALKVASAVYTFLGGAFGVTAAANVGSESSQKPI